MSDEPQPPQLRLRPRKRDDEPVPVVANPPTAPEIAAGITPPVAPTTAEPVEAPARFRLKPKLTSDTETGVSPPASSQPQPAVPAVVEEPVLPPVPPAVVPPAVSDDSAALPRLKFRPPPPGGVASVPLSPPPVAGADPAAVGMSPPAFLPMPVTQPMPLPETSSPSPPVGALPWVIVEPPAPAMASHSSAHPLHLPARSFAPEPVKKKRTLPIFWLVVMMLLGAGGYYVLMVKKAPAPDTQPQPPVHAAGVSGSPAANPSPTPSSSGAQPSVRPKIAPLPPPPPAGGGVVKSTHPVAGPDPSVATAALRAWVEGARITGVVSGASPRAIVNGRLVRSGDVVDASAGIIFDGVDMDRKELVFRNRSGGFASKPY